MASGSFMFTRGGLSVLNPIARGMEQIMAANRPAKTDAGAARQKLLSAILDLTEDPKLAGETQALARDAVKKKSAAESAEFKALLAKTDVSAKKLGQLKPGGGLNFTWDPTWLTTTITSLACTVTTTTTTTISEVAVRGQVAAPLE